MATPAADSMLYAFILTFSSLENANCPQCADVQFSSSVTYKEPSSCKNNTNVAASAFPSASVQRNANESTAEGAAQGSSGSSTTSASTSTSTSKGAAVALQTAAWGVLGAAFAGGLAVL